MDDKSNILFDENEGVAIVVAIHHSLREGPGGKLPWHEFSISLRTSPCHEEEEDTENRKYANETTISLIRTQSKSPRNGVPARREQRISWGQKMRTSSYKRSIHEFALIVCGMQCHSQSERVSGLYIGVKIFSSMGVSRTVQ